MLPLYEHWDNDGETKGIILKGAGEKAFCAGGDVVDIVTTKNIDFFKKEYTLDYLISTLKVPHIAIMDGIVMGGGVGVSVNGKYRIATENSLFAMPETQIGFFCDVGGSHFLSRLEGSLGMYLGLTGERLKGEQLASAGIATHYCPKEKIDILLKELIETECKNVEETLNNFLLNKVNPISTSLDMVQINEIFSKGSVEEIMEELLLKNNEIYKCC